MLETHRANFSGNSSADGTLHSTLHGTAIASVALGLLHAVLNQVDYGLAVVNADTRQLIYANTPALDALNALNADTPQKPGLCLACGVVCARLPAHAAQLVQALARTKTRLRGLLRLADDNMSAANGSGRGGGDSTVAVMPLFDLALPGLADTEAGSAADPCYALLVFPKQQLCDTTTVTLFARERGLTGTEGLVLAMVCKGLRPTEIATRHGVQVCTVRSQLRSIRQKTASDSVRELVEKVSVLPPMARHLQHAPSALPPRNPSPTWQTV